MEKEKEEQEAKKRSDMIAQAGKDKSKLNDEEEEMTESAASDKAKGMGLDYMKFGRYGKDGKVTHKTSGDNLVKVGKDDEPTDDKPAKKPDAPKKDTGGDKEVDTKVKSRNFLKDLDNGDLEDEDGNPIPKKKVEVKVVKKDKSGRISSEHDCMLEIKWNQSVLQGSATVLMFSNYREAFVMIAVIDLKTSRMNKLKTFKLSNKPTRMY